MAKTVIFVHSYCLGREGGGRTPLLTSMAIQAMVTGVKMMKSLNAMGIIVSTAYETWADEFRLQRCYARENGVDDNQIHLVAEAKNSYDEAKRAITKALQLGTNKLVVVAERWHAPRSKQIFEALCPSGLAVRVVSFETPRFKFSLEPSRIKSLRAGWRTTWILWNKLFKLLTPLIIRMSK